MVIPNLLKPLNHKKITLLLLGLAVLAGCSKTEVDSVEMIPVSTQDEVQLDTKALPTIHVTFEQYADNTISARVTSDQTASALKVGSYTVIMYNLTSARFGGSFTGQFKFSGTDTRVVIEDAKTTYWTWVRPTTQEVNVNLTCNQPTEPRDGYDPGDSGILRTYPPIIQ